MLTLSATLLSLTTASPAQAVGPSRIVQAAKRVLPRAKTKVKVWALTWKASRVEKQIDTLEPQRQTHIRKGAICQLRRERAEKVRSKAHTEIVKLLSESDRHAGVRTSNDTPEGRAKDQWDDQLWRAEERYDRAKVDKKYAANRVKVEGRSARVVGRRQTRLKKEAARLRKMAHDLENR